MLSTRCVKNAKFTLTVKKMLMAHYRMAVLGCFLLLVVFLAGCESFRVTPIGEILADPYTYNGRSVTIAGEVTTALNVFVIRTYMLKDSTGEIVVIARDGVPKAGTKHTVLGKVTQALALSDKSLVVIQELPR